MSAQGFKDRWTETRAQLHAGWRWWSGEIAAMMPARLRSALSPGDPVIAIDLEAQEVVVRRFAQSGAQEIAHLPRADFTADTLRATLRPYLARSWFLRDDFALRIPDAAALWRNLSLPLAARGNIANLLSHELERQSPIDRNAVYHDYKIVRVDRGAGRIDLIWRIVRRASVDAALDTCREAGVPLAVVAFIGDETPPDGGTFPVDARASALMRRRKWLVPALAALVLLLTAVALSSTYSRNQQAADALAAQVDQARVDARVTARLQHDIDGARLFTTFLVGQKKGVMASSLLAETTRLLPDGSWLTELEYRDGEVRIQGLSNSAASLIAIFDASPLFTAAEFRAPLVQAQGPGLERFDLAFKLRKGEP